MDTTDADALQWLRQRGLSHAVNHYASSSSSIGERGGEVQHNHRHKHREQQVYYRPGSSHSAASTTNQARRSPVVPAPATLPVNLLQRESVAAGNSSNMDNTAQQPPRRHLNLDTSPSTFDSSDYAVFPIPNNTPWTPAQQQHSRNASNLTTNSNPPEDLVSPIMTTRPGSAASDHTHYSTVSGLTAHFPNNTLRVKPAPAYVAHAGASQVVSEHRGSRLSDDEDGVDAGSEMAFSDPALALINHFLDQLLYSFLSTARSTSMVALRPAVTEVLKARLAREAIASAEEELAELLGGGDDEDETDIDHSTTESTRNWDLELVWKRTRLRVMVYIRLGEMEDEDEQRFVRDEELFHGSERRFSSTTGLVSWAAAIFLTSVLEYVAEQTLQVAGSAAHARVRRKVRSGGAQRAGENVVEEHDVEKVGLNSTLGRLWRTWRKSLRVQAGGNGMGGLTHERTPSGPVVQEEIMSPANSTRPTSFGMAHEGSVGGAESPARDAQEDLEYPEYVLAANIPLPMGSQVRDVHEIETPGLAADPDTDMLLGEILLSDLALASHIALPISKRDIHEIEVPGLARDVDDEDHSPERKEERLFATNLPLPIGDHRRDVDEIEVPGLAADDEDAMIRSAEEPMRRNSFTWPRMPGGLPTPEPSEPTTPVKERPGLTRQRSNSVPTPARTPMGWHTGQTPVVPARKPVPSRNVEQPAPPVDTDLQRQASDRSSVYSQSGQPKEEHEHRGIIGGITAGVAAAGAAAAAAVYGRRESEAEPASQDAMPASQDATPISQEAMPVVGETQPPIQSNKTPAEIEELDKRKSLLDIKALTGAYPSSTSSPGGRTPDTRSSSNVSSSAVHQKVAPVFAQARNSAELAPRQSSETFTLGHRQEPEYEARSPIAEEVSMMEGPEDASGVNSAEAIGVAQTSDVPFAPNEARGPARVVIGDEPPSTDTTAAQNRPRSFSRRSGASSSVSTDQNRFVAQQIASQQRERNTSSPLTEEQPSPFGNGKEVQEHPALQRMASLKRNRGPVDEGGQSLTSASIRGPEDFDAFVQQGETVKYTLTPESVRGMPMNNGRQASNSLSRQQGPGAELSANPATPPTMTSSNAQALNALTAGAPSTTNAPASSDREGRARSSTKHSLAASTQEDDEARKRQHRRSVSRPAPANSRAHSKSGRMAREPRVQTESTRDFADFIRSTGPEKEAFVKPLMSNPSTTSLSSLRSAHINGASASRSNSPAASRSGSVKNGMGGTGVNVPPVPKIPTKAKGSLQPRGADGMSAGNSDLIDFIRGGPEKEGERRISRSVAPFRNTMDSEQFGEGLNLSTSNGIGNEQKSRGLQGLGAVPPRRTSTNSRGAENGNGGAVAHPAYNGRPQTLSTAPASATSATTKKNTMEAEPTRKRYRNKDPYAIDFSDEDDDLVTALPSSSNTNGGRKEESLADFLSSTEPPSSSMENSDPQPLINPNSAQARKLIQNARTSSQTHSFVSKVAGSGSGSTTPLAGNGRTRTQESSGYASPTSAYPNGDGRPLPGTQFMSTSISSGTSTPTGNTSANKPKMFARGSSQRKKNDGDVQDTRDLAAFLRDGPPEPKGRAGAKEDDSAPAPIVRRKDVKKDPKPKKEGKTLGSFFGRGRRKTYLDVA